MPIYEYQCQKCGTFEVTQRITEKSLVKCPSCRGKVKKLISNTSFQLKGTGWYITDYARKGQNGESKGDNGAKSSTESKSDNNSKASSSGTEKSDAGASAKSSSTSNSTSA